ncbi:Velvet complex subunit [Lachnellula suecica]|uniref:Velvet complex subunit n=1 Tax=Lachnellula suecica TaxID=602035 RepID=A0A8T9CA88_9HELO|nr:Velvet complex subunit [Lachnellula suecica]
MNTAYSQASPPHDMQRGSIPNIQEAAYRAGAPGGPQYPTSQHSMPVPQQSQINQAYGDPYNPLAASRAPIPDHIHAEGGFAPLAPGTQPAAPEPMPLSCTDGTWKYELKVVQQPQRARMCGFGDKDRRPITPPPCVRLVITDIKTGKEADLNDIEHGMFVLNVDLWNNDGSKEVNLVRHSQSSPSISLTTPVSYSQVQHDANAPNYSNILPGHGGPVKFEHGQGPSYGTAAYNPYPGPPQVTPYAQQSSMPQSYAGQPGQPQFHPGYAPTTNGGPQYPPQNGYSQPSAQQGYYGQQPTYGSQGGMDYPLNSQPPSYANRPYVPPDMNMARMPVNAAPPGGMFTRNLIGSLAASAFRLTDPDDRIGIWFVLQDLSVRTEGTFRLRFSFVNVGLPAPPILSGGQSSNGQPTTTVNTTKAPVLAACFSECFTVYSAKRFPGVVESTPLSKCFATQGIKIPIRKDGQGPGTRNSERDKEYDDE